MVNKTSIKDSKCYRRCTPSRAGEASHEVTLGMRKQFSAGFAEQKVPGCQRRPNLSRISSGQGAIEYLLLLGAAIIVVSIVVTFMANAVAPAQDSGNQQTYAYICGPILDSNTADCVCYHGNNSKGYFATDAEAQVYCCVTQKNGYLREKYGCP
jgi:hypothetical protein